MYQSTDRFGVEGGDGNFSVHLAHNLNKVLCMVIRQMQSIKKVGQGLPSGKLCNSKQGKNNIMKNQKYMLECCWCLTLYGHCLPLSSPAATVEVPYVATLPHGLLAASPLAVSGPRSLLSLPAGSSRNAQDVTLPGARFNQWEMEAWG